MEEEFITKAIIGFLKKKGFEIISFDFPQSGSGLLLHPNNYEGKNRNSISPDIVAAREDTLIIMENKNRFSIGDFEKLRELRQGNNYNKSIQKLHADCGTSAFLVGVGIPREKGIIEKALEVGDYVDFVVAVNSKGFCQLIKGSL